MIISEEKIKINASIHYIWDTLNCKKFLDMQTSYFDKIGLLKKNKQKAYLHTSEIKKLEENFEVTETIKENSSKLKTVHYTQIIENKLKVDTYLKLIFIDDLNTELQYCVDFKGINFLYKLSILCLKSTHLKSVLKEKIEKSEISFLEYIKSVCEVDVKNSGIN